MEKKNVYLKNIIHEKIYVSKVNRRKLRIQPIFNKITYLWKKRSMQLKNMSHRENSYFNNESRMLLIFDEILAYF